MPNNRRDQLIGAAIQAGKFPESRRAHWQAVYDADPTGTEQTLALLAPGLIPTNPQPLGGRQGNMAGLTLAGSGLPASGGGYPDLTPEVVASWSRQLFPDTARGRTYRTRQRITQHPGD